MEEKEVTEEPEIRICQYCKEIIHTANRFMFSLKCDCCGIAVCGNCLTEENYGWIAGSPYCSLCVDLLYSLSNLDLTDEVKIESICIHATRSGMEKCERCIPHFVN